MLFVLRRNTILNAVSIVLSLLIVVIFLFFGLSNGKYFSLQPNMTSVRVTGERKYVRIAS